MLDSKFLRSKSAYFAWACLSFSLFSMGCDKGSGATALREKLRGSMADKEDGPSFLLEDDSIEATQAFAKVERRLEFPADKRVTKKEASQDDRDTEDDEGGSEESDELRRLTERIKNAGSEDEADESEDKDPTDAKSPAKKVNVPNNRKAEPKSEKTTEVVAAICPSGGKMRGGSPPEANEQWCEVAAADGTNVRQGLYTRWDTKGTKRIEAHYHQGKLDGVLTTYYANGAIEQQKAYKNGEVAGLWSRWNKNGNKEVEVGILGGKRNGKFARWDKNGTLQIQGFYTQDKRSGLWTVFAKNGQARSKISWKDGQKEGKATFYYPNGQIQKEGVFRNGRPDGQWTHFSKDGKPQARGVYQQGKKSGSWARFGKDGQISNMRDYDNGRSKNRRNRDDSGQEEELDLGEDEVGGWKPM